MNLLDQRGGKRRAFYCCRRAWDDNRLDGLKI